MAPLFFRRYVRYGWALIRIYLISGKLRLAPSLQLGDLDLEFFNISS